MRLYFQILKCYVSLQSIFEGTLDVEMINKIKLDGIPEDVVPYIATPDYESIMKSIILMLLLLPLKVFLQV
jgi:hypothetical protein